MEKGKQIKQMLLKGVSYKKIASAVNCSSATISYHAGKMGLAKKSRPTYNWELVQSYIDNGNTVLDICKYTGMAKATYSLAVSKGKITPKSMITRMSLEEILNKCDNVKASSHERRIIKRRFFEMGRRLCEMCGIDSWRGKQLVLELDHKDGNPRNNSLENLRVICPNCHSTTDTWRGRNCRK